MEVVSSSYEDMLEKYRDVDEDALMADMTEEELLQLENEINREVLDAVPNESIDLSDDSNPYSSSDEDSEPKTLLEKYLPAIERRKEFQRQKSLREASVDESNDIDISNAKTTLKKVENEPKSPKPPGLNKFEMPELKKTPKKVFQAKPKPEGRVDPEALKKELIESVKKREIKKRIKRANSSIDRRSSLIGSPGIEVQKRKPKRGPVKENKNAKNGGVNNNFATNEMNDLRSRLKKVTVKEPKLVLPDELHGISCNRITAGVKNKNQVEDEDDREHYANSEDGDTSRNSAYDADNDVTPSVSDGSSVVVCDDEDDKFSINKAISLCSESPSDELATFAASIEPSQYAEPPQDPMSDMAINSNSVEEMLERAKESDPQLLEINLNNIQNIEKDTLTELVDALHCNTKVKSLQLANTGLTDSITANIASLLKKNTTITQLNIESNFITGAGAIKVVAALRKNDTLTELKLDNQRHIFGSKTELEFSKLLKENRSLLKFSYQFSQAGPRMTAQGHLTKNMDLVRKKRLEERKKQSKTAKPPAKPSLRRQPSSEWYRKEKADRIKALQEECKKIASEPEGKGKDKKVENMLQNMKPEEVNLLEQWFAAKLLGNTDKPPQAEHERLKAEEDQKKNTLLPPPPSKKAEHPRAKALKPPKNRGRSPSPASRDDLLQSIRNRGVRLKKVPSPSRSPCLTDASDSDSDYTSAKALNNKNKVKSTAPSIAQQSPAQPKSPDSKSSRTRTEQPPVQNQIQHPPPPPTTRPVITKTQPSIDEVNKDKERGDEITPRQTNDFNATKPSNGSISPDVREWKEDEKYDSDEYEIVEVEVSDSESEDEAVTEDVETFHIREPLKLRIMSDNDDSGMQTISDEDYEEKDVKKKKSTPVMIRNISRDEGVSVRTPSPSSSPKSNHIRSDHSSPVGSIRSNYSRHTSQNDSPLNSPHIPTSPSLASRFSDRSGSSLGSTPRTPTSPHTPRSPLSKYGNRSPGCSSNDYGSRLKPTSPNLTYQRPGSPNVKKIDPKAYSAINSFFK